MSPIKGLSETRRLPRLGKIHLGIKVPHGNGEIPRAVDYFVCPPQITELFGEKPKELRVMIPVEDPEKWASQYYRCYSKSRGLICKGDGETAIRMVDTKTGTLADRNSTSVVLKEIPCQGRECPDYETKCKEVMNLQFLIPEVPGLGVWQIDTGSINSIRNINSTAEMIQGIYGRIAMIPLLLTLEPQETQDKNGIKKTIHVLNLRTKNTLIDMAKIAIRPMNQVLLPPGDSDDVDLPETDSEVDELIMGQKIQDGGNGAKEEPAPAITDEEAEKYLLRLKLTEVLTSPYGMNLTQEKAKEKLGKPSYEMTIQELKEEIRKVDAEVVAKFLESKQGKMI
jgi:hypothetical protein